MPVSCPRCKKRFDYHGNHIKLEQAMVSEESYSSLKDWLIQASQYSLQYNSLEEVTDMMQY